MLLKLQKPPAPAAPREQTSPVHKAARVQAVTCLAQLAPSRQAGNTQGGSSHRSQSPFSSGDWGPPLPPSRTNTSLSIKKKKKNLVERELREEHFRFGDMACTPMHSLPPRVAAAPRRAHHRSPRLVATRRCSVGHRAETCASASQSPACPCKMSACSSWSASYFLP